MFLNYKTQNNNNEQFIIQSLSKDLDIDSQKLSCRYIASRVQEKYSVSHQENRVYHHRLYRVFIDQLLPFMKDDDFVIKGKHYYWMTLDEILHDHDIQEKNLEVVNFVREVM